MKLSTLNPVSQLSCSVAVGVIAFTLAACGEEPPPKPVAKAAPPVAKPAPEAKAASFIRTSGTPIATAAISSSRMAVHARPILESSRRRATTITTTMMSSASR